MSIMRLRDASGSRAGAKATNLATLIQAGFDVPDGFVVPDEPQFKGAGLRAVLVEPVAALTAGATGHLAVRSSGSTEDTAGFSSAGQYESILAVRGLDAVESAILRCRESLWTTHAASYREFQRSPMPRPQMSVLVQRFVDAEVSGVWFAGARRSLEASYGLGQLIVSGQVTPDRWLMDGDIVARTKGAKRVRADRVGDAVLKRPVDQGAQSRWSLDESQVLEIDAMCRAASELLGFAADIEWVLTGNRVQIVQARPITVPVPFPPVEGSRANSALLRGVPASPGIATGPARVVTAMADFASVQVGDVLVCEHTDPAWTPLFRIASAVVTEIGGTLSHAAIVAREVQIPAVLAVPDAVTRLESGQLLEVDGLAGTVKVRGLS